MEKYKIMRMLCMFDLPVETEEQRRAYRIFRKELIEQGFIMMQYSIYVECVQAGNTQTDWKTGSRKIYHWREMYVFYALQKNNILI